MIIFSLIMLVTIMYFVMVKIENTTTMLENHIIKRDLSYTVDKDYSLQKVKTKDQTVMFLNNLTDFFFNFHEQTVNYKKELEEFMNKRTDILNRFNSSSINIYDMTVIPDDSSTIYTLRNKKEISETTKEIEKISKDFQ